MLGNQIFQAGCPLGNQESRRFCSPCTRIAIRKCRIGIFTKLTYCWKRLQIITSLNEAQYIVVRIAIRLSCIAIYRGTLQAYRDSPSVDPDQTGRMRMLIWGYTGRIGNNPSVSWRITLLFLN